MTYFELEPEAAGMFGPATRGDLRARPPLIEKFNYEFDTWLGDPIPEAISTFIVTDGLKEALVETHASRVAFGDVEVTKSGIYLDLYGDDLSPPSPGCKSPAGPERTTLVFRRLAARSFPNGS
jgi:hypothetical protein